MSAFNPMAMAFSRDALYELIWEKPTRALAKEIGVSDAGLAKACGRHRIPIPPRGYWAKKAAGKAVARDPLPIIVDPRLDTVTMTRPLPRPARSTPATAGKSVPVATAAPPAPTIQNSEITAAWERFKEVFPEICVPATLRSALPVVAATLDGLRESGKKRPARVKAPRLFSVAKNDKEPRIDVTAAPKSFGRAARLLDTLLKVCDECEFERGVENDGYSWFPVVKVCYHMFRFRLREVLRRDRYVQGNVQGGQLVSDTTTVRHRDGAPFPGRRDSFPSDARVARGIATIAPCNRGASWSDTARTRQRLVRTSALRDRQEAGDSTLAADLSQGLFCGGEEPHRCAVRPGSGQHTGVASHGKGRETAAAEAADPRA